MGRSYSVLIIDMSHYMDGESEYRIDGFPSFELAREFARRWVRDSVEEMRSPGQSADELRKSWFMWGEDAIVLGGESYAGSHELDFFIANPATTEERNWKAIKKLSGLDG
ncbi:MAG TPA: hypothetical protein VID27_12675 [Blastocatellia bacterium]|jgi:hypothetical protein